VQLEFALVRFALDELAREGFIPIVPPVLIKEEMMRGMGYIDTPEDLAERYILEKDHLFLVGTSEQAVGPMHAKEVFEEKDLPRRYVAFSSCFRREAGSYGKDTKGILRVHQFDKVEMFSFAHPDASRKEHLFLLSMAEHFMQFSCVRVIWRGHRRQHTILNHGCPVKTNIGKRILFPTQQISRPDV
jgi:seryl-tRNA synthetase